MRGHYFLMDFDARDAGTPFSSAGTFIASAGEATYIPPKIWYDQDVPGPDSNRARRADVWNDGFFSLWPECVQAADAGYHRLMFRTCCAPWISSFAGGICNTTIEIQDGWSQIMRDTAREFFWGLEHDLDYEDIMLYYRADVVNTGSQMSPSSPGYLTGNYRAYVNQFWLPMAQLCAFHGCSLGLDAFALVQHRDPEDARAIIEAIHGTKFESGSRTSAMPMAIEGWPFLNDEDKPYYFQSRCVSVGLLSSRGQAVLAATYDEFRKINPQGVGLAWLNGSGYNDNWSGGVTYLQRAASLAKARDMPLVSSEYNAPAVYEAVDPSMV